MVQEIKYNDKPAFHLDIDVEEELFPEMVAILVICYLACGFFMVYFPEIAGTVCGISIIGSSIVVNIVNVKFALGMSCSMGVGLFTIVISWVWPIVAKIMGYIGFILAYLVIEIVTTPNY